MTIVPREWERQRVSPAALTGLTSLTRLRVTFLVMGVLCLVLGAVILAQGEILGVAAVCFGLGYVARALVPRQER